MNEKLAEVVAQAMKNGQLLKLRRIKTGKCISCHAPVSGEVGRLIVCRYCDTEQIL